MAGYWNRVTNRRVTRRRALLATGAFGMSVALLAACGGDEESPTTTGSNPTGSTGSSGGSPGATGGSGTSSLLTVPSDTTAEATPGGVSIHWFQMEPDNLEPVAQSGSTPFYQTTPVYSRLAKYGKGVNEQLPTTEMITGDAALSWELRPDAMQLTMKLRPDHKFDPRPPTNNRAMTTEDVKFSMERFEAGSAFRGELFNHIAPTGMVSAISYPDAETVVIDLAFPYAQILDVIAYYPYFNVLPVEAEGGFNPRTEARGSGPFRLREWRPSERFIYERNPDWYEEGRPFLDGMEHVVVPEYATALAQFEAGGLWTFAVAPEDILSVKGRRPEMPLQRDIALIKAPQFQFWQFSFKPESPFLDARLRQAISMLVDRDAYIDAFYNISLFQAEGLPIEGLWHSHHFALQPNWIDPKNDPEALGEGARFFQFNPEEAAALVSAAGFDSVDLPMNWRQGGVAARQNEAIAGMLGATGIFAPDIRIIDQVTYREYQSSVGMGFDGMFVQTNGGHNEEAWFLNMYHPAGKFAISPEEIPVISEKTVAIRQELDGERRNTLIRELQADLANEMPNMLMPGYAIGFTLHQPWLKNYGVFVSGDLNPNWSSSRVYTEYWYDQSADRR